jgi:NADH-quinone oxidoreductase subunit F
MINGTERILVCCGYQCAKNSALEIASAIEEELARRDGHDVSSVEVVHVGCVGECDQGPIVRFMPRDITYYRVSAKHVAAIVDSLYGEPVKKLLFRKKRQHFEKLSDNPYFGLQNRTALRYMGVVAPMSIDDYIAHGGYAVLKSAQSKSCLATLTKLQESGLRIKCGKASSPAPTWLEAGRQAPRRIVCNVNANGFDDPVGISLAEGSPHALVEGMAVAMHATKAGEGIFRMRQKDILACNVLQRAIEDACASEVFGTAFGKIECITNHSEPDYDDSACESAALALDAETLAAIPPMLSESLEHHNGGDEASPRETKAFALGGKAKHKGFVECPMGTSLRTLIFKIGGGVMVDRPLKAVKVGKPAGTYLPESLIDLPIDFDSFAQHGIPMQAGSVSILDDHTCIVRMVCSDFQRLCAPNQNSGRSESENLSKAIALLKRLCAGNGDTNDVELLNQIALSMRATTTNRCEQRAANSLLSSIEHFRDEFEAHACEKRCPAGSCPKLTQFVISPEACAGCDACTEVCPAEAIIGEQREPHVIDFEKCISCGTCRDVCRFHAVLTERRSPQE